MKKMEKLKPGVREDSNEKYRGPYIEWKWKFPSYNSHQYSNIKEIFNKDEFHKYRGKNNNTEAILEPNIVANHWRDVHYVTGKKIKLSEKRTNS